MTNNHKSKQWANRRSSKQVNVGNYNSNEMAVMAKQIRLLPEQSSNINRTEQL